MTGLDLSNNDLSGPLPGRIDHIIPFVVTLDLSSNNFSGNLPDALGNCTYLNVLNLQHNQFRGRIPWQLGLLSRLTTFNVADNPLSGQIPTFINKTFGPENFANTGLCGKPLKDCVGPPKKSHTGVIIGAAVGGIIFAIIVVVVLISALRVVEKVGEEEDVEGNEWAKSIKGTKGIRVSIFEKLVPKMRLFNLIKATNNFSKKNIIDVGRTGSTYKANRSDGSLLAVKRLQETHHSDKHFVYEITALARIRHCNLVPLLGFCIARRERLLIYKYMPKGTLYDQLYHVNSEVKVLDWAKRLRIGIGVARGLAWLHHHCNPCIIHRGISSKCILLDEDYEPKISDFGFARLLNPENSHLTVSLDGNVDGSTYIAPEYKHRLVATPKGDVYCFGMVLLELISGKTPAEVANAVQNVEDNTVEWITYLFNMYAKDSSLVGRLCDGEIVTFLKAAFACVVSCPENRPTMLEVYQLLRAIGARYGFIDEDEGLMQSDSINITSIA
ncbi:hypothetical protein AAC387_Pa12g1431 [Persea americana]